MRPPFEIELVEKARVEGGAALETLLEAAWPLAYRIAYSILRDRGSAEDAAQEACAIVYRTITQLRSSEAFRVWLYRIVVREARRIAKRVAKPNPVPAWTPAADETHLDVQRALDSLPLDLRTVVILHYYLELTSREIAEILRVPAATVRFRLVLARHRLKPLLGYGAERRTAAQTKGYS